VKNYYDVLQVRKDASSEEIKKSYRRLARQYHPDLNNGDNKAEEKFKEIGEAYAILIEEESRKKYDLKFFGKKEENQYENKKKHVYKEQSNAKIDIENIEASFENFFGFNPKTKEKKINNKKNPIDTTGVFESFFGVGKK